MMPILLLPLLFAGADPKVVATGDHERVEHALSVAIRARVAAGWKVVDLRTVQDDFVVTVSRKGTIEKHVLHDGEKSEYRVELADALPADATEPSGFTLEALVAPRGGIQIVASCGGYYEKPFIIDDEASGEFATSLVARSLATADDVHTAWSRSNSVVFSIRKNAVMRDLVVWLDAKGNVIEAQVRRFEHDGGEATTYKRLAELKRSTHKARVLSISTKGSLALMTTSGFFVLDPSGNAFDRDGDYEGCGC